MMGEVIIPFPPGTSQVQRTIVIGSADGFASCIRHTLPPELYTLAASVFIDPESVLPFENVPLLVRASLWIDVHPIEISALEDVKIEVVTQDAQGVRSTPYALLPG